MLGGVPNTEIEAMNGMLSKYGIAASDIFADRGTGYSDFKECCATKALIKDFITVHTGVAQSHDNMLAAFDEFWAEAGTAVNHVHTDMGIAEFCLLYTTELVKKLAPLGILDQFQSRGVFANWWNHSYTVREYTEIEKDADDNDVKVNVKEVIRIKNVFKTIGAESFVSSLVSDDKIARVHFVVELDELNKNISL